MSSIHFDPSNERSLDGPEFVLRDSLGVLAVQVLASRADLSKMSYFDMLNELLCIIKELHAAYDRL